MRGGLCSGSCFQGGNPEPWPLLDSEIKPWFPPPRACSSAGSGAVGAAGVTAVPATPQDLPAPRARSTAPKPLSHHHHPTRAPWPWHPQVPWLRSPRPWRGQPVSPPPPATPLPRGPSHFRGDLCACLPLPAVPRTARRLYTRRLPTRLHRTHDNPTVTNHKDSFAMGCAPGVDARGHHAEGQGEASRGGGAGQDRDKSGGSFLLLLVRFPLRDDGRPVSVTPKGFWEGPCA